MVSRRPGHFNKILPKSVALSLLWRIQSKPQKLPLNRSFRGKKLISGNLAISPSCIVMTPENPKISKKFRISSRLYTQWIAHGLKTVKA
jgi:hypothetical protein